MTKALMLVKAIIDLQFFASGDVVHGVSQYINTNNSALSENYGTGGLAPEVKEYWSKKLIEDAKPQYRFYAYGQKESIPAHNGKTIEFRKFSSLGKKTDPLLDGFPGSAQKLSVTPKVCAVDWFGGYIEYTERMNLIAIDPLMSIYEEKLRDQAVLSQDCLIRDVVNAGTNVMYASTYSSGSYSSVTSRDGLDTSALPRPTDIYTIAAKLQGKNAPLIGGGYIAIIHPYALNGLMMNMTDDFNWIDAHKYASPEQIEAGEVGMIDNVRFVTSTNQSIYYGDKLGGTTTFRNLTTKGAIEAATSSITFDNGTRDFTTAEIPNDSLIGRYVLIGGKKYYVSDNTNTSITIADPDDHTTAATISSLDDNTVVYPGEGGAAGIATSAITVLADNAYGVVDIAGSGAMEFIVKPLGWNDVFNMKGAMGWKSAFGTIRLQEDYIIRYECAIPSNLQGAVTSAN